MQELSRHCHSHNQGDHNQHDHRPGSDFENGSFAVVVFAIIFHVHILPESRGSQRLNLGDMSAEYQGCRAMFVHAHPDDETLSTGATMAYYAKRGAHVTLVTCTSGELGEVLVAEWQHLTADEDDTLGEHRREELAAACAALGVTDQVYLGGPGHYRDSGMAGEPSNQDPRCFWQADFSQAVAELVQLIRDRRPQVLVTYDEFGGYGHPDHIQANRISMAAVQLAAIGGYRPELGPTWQVAKVYWTALPKSLVAQVLAKTDPTEHGPHFAELDVASAPFLIDDRWLTTALNASDCLAAKAEAIKAHRSQIDPDLPFFAHVGVGRDAMGWEFYRAVQPAWQRTHKPLTTAAQLCWPGEQTNTAASEWERDLFAGISRQQHS